MSQAASTSPKPLFDHVVIVGVGLIGGSIAKALKAKGVAGQVTGLGRNRERLLDAQRAGLLDDVATSASELKPFDLAVVCTPVDRIVADVRALQAVAPPTALITDVGSVKGRICRELSPQAPGVATFIGSHPLAGSEQGGWEHADENLFQGKVCAVTPCGQRESAVFAISLFWTLMGMRSTRVNPERHDHIVALTSHLPHAAAAAIASLMTEEARSLGATGFRDTTRVASGDPALWTAILIENRDAVADQLKTLVGQLGKFQQALEQGDARAVEALLTQGKKARDQWLKSLEIYSR